MSSVVSFFAVIVPVVVLAEQVVVASTGHFVVTATWAEHTIVIITINHSHMVNRT